MKTKIWIDGLFSSELLKATSNLLIDSFVISFDPQDYYFCPMHDAIPLIKECESKLINVVIKFDHTSELTFKELIKKLDTQNCLYEVLLADYGLLSASKELKKNFYIICDDGSTPSIDSRFFKGYLFLEDPITNVSSSYLKGLYTSIDKVKDQIKKVDFSIIPVNKYETGYRNIDYSKLKADIAKALN